MGASFLRSARPTAGVMACAALAVTCGALILTAFAPRATAQAPATTPAAAPVTKPAAPASRPAVAPVTRPASGPATVYIPRPDPRPVPADPNALTDEKIGNAIRKGAEWMLTQFDPKTNKIKPDEASKADTPAHEGGLDALCVYALMQSGLALGTRDPIGSRLDLKGKPMLAMIEAMASYDLNKGHPQSYAYGLRATALALYVTERTVEETNPDDKGAGARGGRPVKTENQKNVEAVRAALEKDAMWCLLACDGGAYHYVMPAAAPKTLQDLMKYYGTLTRNLPAPKGSWDNSTSQYGLLGVWSAAEAGIEIPTPYWFLVDNHWKATQLKNGQWAYSVAKGEASGGTVPMTTAGLASMLVTHEYIEPPNMAGNVGREAFSPSVQRGLEWFETGDNCVNAGGGYGLYGVERVGLASGFKHFGKHDWYRLHANRIIAGQNKQTGAFGSQIETAYKLLFLARGRHPIMMNKLRFDGFWANRPRDASNLAKHTSKVVERPLNWQVINLGTTDWPEWTDSPVLTLASHKAPKMTPADVDKIRGYIEAGGVLYTQADGASPEFNTFATKLAKDLFPQYELEPVPPTHPLLSADALYGIKPPLPPLKMVSNGARILMVHSPTDVSRWWQQRDDKAHRQAFQLGINLFFYAAGKRDLRNRINSAYVPPATTAAIDTVKVARVQYAGAGWDPEPGAWRRYVNWFQRNTGTKVDLSTVKLADLKPLVQPAMPAGAATSRPATAPDAVPVAAAAPASRPATRPTTGPGVKVALLPRADGPLLVHLTGTAKQTFNADEAKALRAYVDSGGVALIDGCGGPGVFEQSAAELLKAAFPNVIVRSIPPEHPLLLGDNPGTEDLTRRRLREATVAKLGRSGGQLMILSSGQGHVLFSPLDITSGLLPNDIGGILGYEPAYSQALLKNIIFWTLDGQKD